MMKHNVSINNVIEAILDGNSVAAHDAAMAISRRDGGAAVDIIAQAKKEAFVVRNAGKISAAVAQLPHLIEVAAYSHEQHLLACTTKPSKHGLGACKLAELHVAHHAPKAALVRHCKMAHEVGVKTAPTANEIERRLVRRSQMTETAIAAKIRYFAGCAELAVFNNTAELTAELKAFVLGGCKCRMGEGDIDAARRELEAKADAFAAEFKAAAADDEAKAVASKDMSSDASAINAMKHGFDMDAMVDDALGHCHCKTGAAYGQDMKFTYEDAMKMAEDHTCNKQGVHAMKNHEGMGTVFALILQPSMANGKLTCLRGILSTTATQIHNVNRGYMVPFQRLQSVLGTPKDAKKCGSDQIVILDASKLPAVSSEASLQAVIKAANILSYGFYLVKLGTKDNKLVDSIGNEYDGSHYDVVVPDPEVMGQSIVITGNDDIYGNVPYIANDVYLKKDGSPKNGVKSFVGDGDEIGDILPDKAAETCGQGQNTPSQGRKSQMSCYENTTIELRQKYRRALAEATIGESEINRGRKVDPKGLTDINNRQSSKATAMGMQTWQKCSVDEYAILFKQDDNTDGAFKWASSCIARNLMVVRNVEWDKLTDEQRERAMESVYGYLIQSRPYTIKGAGLVIADEDIRLLLERAGKVLVINPNTASDELREELNTMLSKAGRGEADVKLGKPETFVGHFKGVNGVVVTRSMDVAPDGVVCTFNQIHDVYPGFLADLNAVKDCFDVRKVDGINVLQVAAEDPMTDFRNAHTSAQLLKCFLRAMKECPSIPDEDKTKFRRFCAEAMLRVIRRQVEEDCDYSAKPKKFGSEMIDTSYVAGVARDLNPESLECIPGLFRGVMEDVKKRLEKTINFDRYSVAGHVAMLTCDFAYELVGESVLTMTKDYVEVIDPVWDRYARETGRDDDLCIGIKHPSMGTQEFLKIVVVPIKEVLRRIFVLQKKLGFSDYVAWRLCFHYVHLKEGLAVLPSRLAKIAMIAAGLDLDGDEMIVLFCEAVKLSIKGASEDEILEHVFDIVLAMWESGLPMKAVKIVPGGTPDKSEMVVDDASYIRIMKKFLMMGNKGVGQVTNSHRVLDELLLVDTHAEDARSKIGFFYALDEKVFGFTRGHGHDYVPQVAETEDGEIRFLSINRTKADIVDAIKEAAAGVRTSYKNCLALHNDLDVLGRHVQELTIDSQKKFFKVVADYIDTMKGFTILPLFAHLGFDLNLGDTSENSSLQLETNSCYSLNEENKVVFKPVTVIKNRSGKKTSVLADAFADFRAEAFNYAFGKLDAMRTTYVESLNCGDDLEAEFEGVAKRLKNENVCRIQHAIKMVRTANSLYRKYMDALMRTYVYGNDVSALERDLLTDDVRNEVNRVYGDMMANIDNEVRRIAALAGVTNPSDIVTIAAGGNTNAKDGTSLVVGGLLGKLLKPETVYYLAERSDTPVVTREYHGKKAEAILDYVDSDKVWVADGFIGSTDIKTDLMDGTYSIDADDEGNVTLERPITDFIDVPSADMNKITFQTTIDDMCTEESLQAIAHGQHLRLVHEKVMKKRGLCDAVMLKDENDNAIAEVMAGDFSQFTKVGHEFSFNVISPMYAGREGDFASFHIMPESVDAEGKKTRRYVLMTLENVTETVANSNAGDKLSDDDIESFLDGDESAIDSFVDDFFNN